MSFFFNGTSIKRLYFNGTEIKKLYMNGVQVWTSEFVHTVNLTIGNLGIVNPYFSFKGYINGVGGAVSPFQIDTPTGIKTITVYGTSTPNFSTFWFEIGDSSYSSVEVNVGGVWYTLINNNDGRWYLTDQTLTGYINSRVGQTITTQIRIK